MDIERDERISELSYEVAMCLRTGLPVFPGYEYELVCLVEDDERTLIELAANIPAFSELIDTCSEYSGEEAWNLRNALDLIDEM